MIMGKLALIPVVLRFFVLFLKNYLDLVHVCSYIYARNWLYKWGVRAMENLFRVILNQDFPSRHPDYVFRASLDRTLERDGIPPFARIMDPDVRFLNFAIDKDRI